MEDLSWSGIVNSLQGDEKMAASLLNDLAIELEEVRKNLNQFEKKVALAKSREATLLRASNDIVRHLKRELPLAVKKSDYIVVISKDNLTIERNVI